MAVYTAIDDAGIFYSTKLYTGTGSSLATTGVGFQPDFTWIKNRDTTDFHVLTDAVRGVTKYISSNASTASTTNVESLKSFDSDGFTVGTMNEVNTNTEDFVSWNWKAGTTTGIAGSPSITPAGYSFNQTCGFSAVEYVGNATAGDSIPHGLGKIPEMMIVKKTSGSADMMVYHAGMDDPAKYLILNTTAAEGSSADIWNDTVPTSTVWTSGNDSNVNGSGQTFICYAFTGIQGYSKFGSYVGNGSSDGTFVYTGFRPARFMLKSTTSTQGWLIVDNKRVGYNTDNKKVYANSTEADTLKVNSLLSNGWKIGDNSDTYNTSGVKYIYMAFAEAPFVNSSGLPVNAR